MKKNCWRVCYTQQDLKNMLNYYNWKIFLEYFEIIFDILEINIFQNKNQSLSKKPSCFLKMADIGNNKLMRLLIIAGGSCYWAKNILHIKERRKQRKWVHFQIKKRDSKGASDSIINDLTLVVKILESSYEWIHWQPFLYCYSI